MFNAIESYSHAGKQAGKAARAHDIGLLNHWSRWQREAERYETPADRKLAREAYDREYRAHARG